MPVFLTHWKSVKGWKLSSGRSLRIIMEPVIWRKPVLFSRTVGPWYTLEDAIAYAASLAELYSSDGYSVVGYPQPLTLVEEFMSSLGQRYEEPSILSGTPFEALGKAVGSLKAQEPGLVYARLPYALEIR